MLLIKLDVVIYLDISGCLLPKNKKQLFYLFNEWVCSFQYRFLQIFTFEEKKINEEMKTIR